MQSINSHNIKTVPDHYTALTHWVISSSSEKLFAFMEAAFGAEEVANSRVVNDNGVVINLVAVIGDSRVLMFDRREGVGCHSCFPEPICRQFKRSYQKVISLGAICVTNPTSLWFGDTVCRILDPFGNIWWLSERVEEVDRTDSNEVKQKLAAPEAKQGIAYIQASLNEAMKIQKRFWEEQE